MKKEIKEIKNMVSLLQKKDGNEAETRRRIDKILESPLCGYDSFNHLSRENAVAGVGTTEHADYTICISPNKISVVIEVKRVGIDLNDNHLKQGARYAYDLGCEWVLLSNGRQWKLYHIEFSKPPNSILIESWDILNDSADDVIKKFNIISLKAIKSGNLEKLWQRKNALNPNLLVEVLASESCINMVKKHVRKQTKCLLTDDEIYSGLKALFNDNSHAKLAVVKSETDKARRNKEAEKNKKIDEIPMANNTSVADDS